MSIASSAITDVSILDNIPAVIGFPVNTAYFAELTAKTSFPGFVQFATNPVTINGELLPAGTRARYAFRFAVAGSIVTFTGTDWQPITGADSNTRILNGMTSTDVDNLSATDMVATNGFDSGTPYLQLIVYMDTTDSTVTPSIDGVTIQYTQGTGADVVWANHFTSDVPVAGGTAVPAGTYIWDLVNGYRLEDGQTDVNQAIEKEFELQDFQASDNVRSVAYAWEVDVRTDLNGATFDVEIISDDETIDTKTVTTDVVGRKVYRIGVPHTDHALTHRVKVRWTNNNLTFYRMAVIYEDSGRSKP